MPTSLKNYLKNNKITQREFAKRISKYMEKKVSPNTICRWCNGFRIPNRLYMMAIIEITSGKIDCTEFYKS